MALEDNNLWRYATEAAVGVVSALVAVIWRSNAAALAELGERLDKKADRHETNNAILRESAKNAEENQRAEAQRKELQAGVERIYDTLDGHRKDTQSKFDTIITALHVNSVAMLKELNSKVDK